MTGDLQLVLMPLLLQAAEDEQKRRNLENHEQESKKLENRKEHSHYSVQPADDKQGRREQGQQTSQSRD